MILTPIFFLLLASFELLACAPMDISSSLGPPRNQDGLGWCAGFAFSDLLSHHTGVRVSAQDISISSIHEEKVSFQQSIQNQEREFADLRRGCAPGGVTRRTVSNWAEYCQSSLAMYPRMIRENRALLASTQNISVNDSAVDPYMSYQALLRKGGVCLERDFPSDGFRGDAESSWWMLLGYRTQHEALSARYEDLNADLRNNNCSDAQGILRDMIPHQQLGNIIDLLKHTRANLRPVIIRNTACRNRSHLPQLRNLSLNTNNVENSRNRAPALAQLNHALDQGHPAQVGVHFSFAMRGPAIEDRHAVLVVGRRAAPGGRCEYKIRNSWGPGCSSYSSRIRPSCSNGSIWVSQNDILSNLISVSTLDRGR